MLELKNSVSTFLKSEYGPLIPLRVLSVEIDDVKPYRIQFLVDPSNLNSGQPDIYIIIPIPATLTPSDMSNHVIR